MKKIIISIVTALFALAPAGATFACAGDETGELKNADCAVEEALVEEESSEGRFQAAEDLETEAEWKSSVFFAGNTVNDNSLVSGIGMIAGNLVNISGIYDYGLMAGNNVTIDGEYKNDAFLAGNMINFTKDAKLGRDLYVAGNVVTISTSVNGNVYAVANKIVLDGAKINGDLIVSVPEVEAKGEVVVAGLFKHNSNTAINGDVAFGTEETYQVEAEEIKIEYSFTDRLIVAVFNLACSIVVAVLFALIGKKFFTSFHEKVKQYDFAAGVTDFGIGLLSLVMTPVVAIFLMLTIVGLPAALIGLLIYAVLLVLSSTVFAEWLGEKILKKGNTIVNAILGLVILTVIELIPVVGSIISFVALTMGLGMMLRVFFKKKA